MFSQWKEEFDGGMRCLKRVCFGVYLILMVVAVTVKPPAGFDPVAFWGTTIFVSVCLVLAGYIAGLDKGWRAGTRASLPLLSMVVMGSVSAALIGRNHVTEAFVGSLFIVICMFVFMQPFVYWGSTYYQRLQALR